MTVELAKVTIVPDDIIRADLTKGAAWRGFGTRSWAKAREIAPVGKGVAAPMQKQREHGQLKASMTLRFFFGADGHFEIGSKLQTESVPGGAGPVSLFALIELGSSPHPIDAINGPFLVFMGKGGVVFTPHVNHPGHPKKNPFVERATQQILHEMDGLTLVSAR
jgi:hypothetical protein